ncbi:MAG: MerR family transcriptional regulator, partial [Rhodococcus sp. (in: high G+C Gram-positive bacteria)]
IELTNQVEALQARVSELAQEVANVHASYRRDLVPIQRNALVVWKPKHQR